MPWNVSALLSPVSESLPLPPFTVSTSAADVVQLARLAVVGAAADRDGDGVGPRGVVGGVGVVAAVEGVAAVGGAPGVHRVVAGAAVEGVVRAAAEERVAGAVAVEDVRPAVAGQVVASGAALGVLGLDVVALAGTAFAVVGAAPERDVDAVGAT